MLRSGPRAQLLRDSCAYIRRQKDHEVVGIGGGHHSRNRGDLSDGRLLPLMWTEYGYMALGSTIHGEQNRDRRTEMEGCHITPMWHQTSRPDPTLQHMQFRVLGIT